MFTVEIDESPLITKLFNAKAKQLERVVNGVVNDLSRRGATVISKQIRKIYRIKLKDITRATTKQPSNFRTLTAFNRYTSRRIGIHKFRVGRKGKGFIKIKIKKAGPVSLMLHAFGTDKNEFVFSRVGRERLPVKILYTLSVSRMVITVGFKAHRKLIKDILQDRVHFHLEKVLGLPFTSG